MSTVAILLLGICSFGLGYFFTAWLDCRAWNRTLADTIRGRDRHITAVQEEADFWRKYARRARDNANEWEAVVAYYRMRTDALSRRVQQLLDERPTDELAQRRARDGEGA